MKEQDVRHTRNGELSGHPEPVHNPGLLNAEARARSNARQNLHAPPLSPTERHPCQSRACPRYVPAWRREGQTERTPAAMSSGQPKRDVPPRSFTQQLEVNASGMSPTNARSFSYLRMRAARTKADSLSRSFSVFWYLRSSARTPSIGHGDRPHVKRPVGWPSECLRSLKESHYEREHNDQIKGTAHQIKGAVKEKIGNTPMIRICKPTVRTRTWQGKFRKRSDRSRRLSAYSQGQNIAWLKDCFRLWGVLILYTQRPTTRGCDVCSPPARSRATMCGVRRATIWAASKRSCSI